MHQPPAARAPAVSTARTATGTITHSASNNPVWVPALYKSTVRGIAVASDPTWTGNGTDNNWSTGANWDSNVPPASSTTTDVIFDGNTRLMPVMDSSYTLRNLSFGAGIGAGGNVGRFTLSATPGSILKVASIVNYSSQPQTVDIILDFSSNSNGSSTARNYDLTGLLTFNGNINLGNGGGLGLGGSVLGGGPIRVNGVISGLAGVGTEGDSTVTLTGANTYSGGTSVGSALLQLFGNAGSISNSFQVDLRAGSKLIAGDATATTANPNRLPDKGVISFFGAEFDLVGSNNTAPSTELIGQLAVRFTGRSGIVTIEAPNGPTTLSAQGVSGVAFFQGPGSTVLFRGASLGQPPGPGTTRVLFAQAPMLVGGGGSAGTTNISIAPTFIGGFSASDPGSSFLTYGANGLRPLNLATEYASNFAGANATDNVRVAGTQSLASSRTINSLVVTGGASGGGNLTLDPAASLSITSGAVLFSGGSDNLIKGGMLDFGSATAFISAAGIGRTEVGSSLAGSGGVVFTGDAPMVVSGANSYSGITYITSAVKITSNTALGATGTGNQTIISTSNTNLGVSLGNNVTVAEDFEMGFGGFRSSGADFGSITAVDGTDTLNGSISLGSSTGGDVALFARDGAHLIANGPISATGVSGLPSVHLGTFGDGSTIEVNGSITGGWFSLTFDGAGGTSRITAANDILVDTIVRPGAVALINNTTGSGTGQSFIQVQGVDPSHPIPGKLGGIGRIDPADGNTVALMGGTIAPGDPALNNGIGTLTIGSLGSENDLVCEAGSAFVFRLGTAFGSARLNIFGNLTLDGPGISISLTDAGDVAPGLYTLIQYSQALKGDFSNMILGTLPPGWMGQLINDPTNKAIEFRLDQVPEPSTWALVLGGIGMLLCIQRARCEQTQIRVTKKQIRRHLNQNRSIKRI